MFNNRKTEILALLTDTIRLDCKELGISEGETPLSKITKILDSYFKEREGFLKNIYEQFDEDSSSLTPKKAESKMRALLGSRPDEREYQKNTNVLLNDTGLEITIEAMRTFFAVECKYNNSICTNYPIYARLHGTIIENSVKLSKLQVDLATKWNKTTEKGVSHNKKATAQLYKTEALLEKSLEKLRKELQDGDKLISKLVKKGFSFLIDSNPITKVAEKAYEIIKSTEKPIDEIVPIFKEAMKKNGDLSIMYAHTKADVEEYLEELSLEKTVDFFEDQNKHLEKQIKKFKSKALQSDGEELFKRCREQVKKHLEQFHKTNRAFIRSHEGIFLGMISPENLDIILGTDSFDEVLKNFKHLNIEKKLKEYVQNSVNTWYRDIEQVNEHGEKEHKKEVQQLLNMEVHKLQGLLNASDLDLVEKIEKQWNELNNKVSSHMKK
ncbi:hypothetical protein [Flagellimonas marina]|uniref:Uncharacterized protein n=1 Tax=Flagellimonas marina TaxID=1775168 RepID=A0ABV8PQ87_9FLAO